MNTLLLIQLIAAHLVSDFILQPHAWVKSRRTKHWKSEFLYFHAIITAVTAWIFTGFLYWKIPVVLFVTHLIIDLWKSYRSNGIAYFILDQSFHLIVTVGLWTWFSPVNTDLFREYMTSFNNLVFWSCATGAVFLTMPASVIIGMLTKRWRDQVEDENKSLENAGKWIGILERLIVFVLILNEQYEAIGLLIAAKSILRFNETRGAQMRTEYLLIGTLISMVIAISTGLLIKSFLT
jgi:hypothetical protein